MFVRIKTYFNLLTRQGPVHIYCTKPPKSVLIVHPENLELKRVLYMCHGFMVRTGAHYLGGYIRDDESKSDWLIVYTLTCEKNISRPEKLRLNIPRRVTPPWHAQYDQIMYFCNASPGTRGMNYWEWRRLFRKPFLLVLSLERKPPFTRRRSSKYNDGQKIWTGTPEYSDVSKGK